MNNLTLDQKDITIKIENPSTKNQCNDTGIEKIWTRNCPKCNKTIICSTKKYMKRSNKISSLCHSCAFTGRLRPEEYRKKVSNSLKGRKLSEEHKQKIKEGYYNLSSEKLREISEKLSISHKGIPSHRKGKTLTKEWKRKIRIGLLNMDPKLKEKIIDGNRSRIISDETRRKMRLSRIEYIEKIRCKGGKLTPRFSIKACDYFNSLSLKNGWNLQHGLNGGEIYLKDLGYWLDAYDKENNIVVEYDEGHHNKQKEKDTRRMNEIKKLLKCKFYRYDAVNKELNEY